MSRSAVFVDVSSLNVVLKFEDKFVLAINYGGGLHRLPEVMSVLGTGYDVYLCMMPRGEGEGDFVIDELSITGLPFTANREELLKVLSFFRKVSGVSSVYLCNWLANYIACARVSTFESVFYYGTRVAHIAVKDRMLQSFTLYGSQLEFSEATNSEYTGYGDVGLLDIDSIVAQYPELRSVAKVPLTAITPLIQCYKTPIKMYTDELYERLQKEACQENCATNEPVEQPETETEGVSAADVNATPASSEIPDPPKFKDPRPNVEIKPRRKTPLLAKVFLGISCILAFTVGSSIRVIYAAKSDEIRSEYFDSMDSRINALQQLATIYSSGVERVSSAETAYTYAVGSGLGVSIIGYDLQLNGNEVRCACASPEIAGSYKEYIEEKYTVLSTNDLGISQSADGSTVYQFSISFV